MNAGSRVNGCPRPSSLGTDVAWICSLALLTLLTRVGSLRFEVLDWDESTFMLIAQDLLRGHLPYTNLFDNKPPGIFFLIAGFFEIFGASVASVRLLGGLCVFAIAITCHLALRRRIGSASAGVAAGLLVVALAARPFLHLSTELPATLALILAFVIVLDHGEAFAATIAAGALVSLAVCMRSNLAIVAVAVGGLHVLASITPWLRSHRFGAVGLVVGGLPPLIALVAVYAAAGEIDALVASAVLVPLHYSESQSSVLEVARSIVAPLWSPTVRADTTVVIGTGAAAVGVVLAFGRGPAGRLAALGISRRDVVLFAVTGAATVLSVLVGGAFYPHHLIQILPFVVMVAGVAMAVVRPLVIGRIAQAGTAIVVVAVTVVTMQRWGVLEVLRAPRSVEAGHHVVAAARAIAADRRPGETIWALDFHLVLFYLDELPISRILAHPSNITRRAILAPMVRYGRLGADELGRVMDLRPDHLVLREGQIPPPYLKSEPSGSAFRTWLSANYAHRQTFGPVALYRRISPVE